MKILYLLPPSEGKNSRGELGKEKLSFVFPKPLDIAINATEKDLKCKDKRYEQGIELNKNIENSDVLSAIERYSGVMYNAIDYAGMSEGGKEYFDDHFLILSGMYGILRPDDTIGNYKLPIETKGLYKFWGKSITLSLDALQADYIIDMLPSSYAKMIDWKSLKTPQVRVEFIHQKDGELKKMTHGVKKVKGAYIHALCHNSPNKIEDFPGNIEKIFENNYHILVTHT